MKHFPPKYFLSSFADITSDKKNNEVSKLSLSKLIFYVRIFSGDNHWTPKGNHGRPGKVCQRDATHSGGECQSHGGNKKPKYVVVVVKADMSS